jgi:hypothetical protein
MGCDGVADGSSWRQRGLRRVQQHVHRPGLHCRGFDHTRCGDLDRLGEQKRRGVEQIFLGPLLIPWQFARAHCPIRQGENAMRAAEMQPEVRFKK